MRTPRENWDDAFTCLGIVGWVLAFLVAVLFVGLAIIEVLSRLLGGLV